MLLISPLLAHLEERTDDHFPPFLGMNLLYGSGIRRSKTRGKEGEGYFCSFLYTFIVALW